LESALKELADRSKVGVVHVPGNFFAAMETAWPW
jgi:hypothetical protein